MQNEFKFLCNRILRESEDDDYRRDAYRDDQEVKGLLKDVTYENESINGAELGHPGKMYHVVLRGNMAFRDDSDFDRDTGYGRHLTPIDFTDISEFSITEYDDPASLFHELGEEGRTLRNQDEIETQDSELYTKLRLFAVQAAVEQES